MKSSVTNRKQRFWALLLAVVMVVGLLPVADIKAANNFGMDDNDVSKFVVGAIIEAGDIVTNQNNLMGSPSTNDVKVYYKDANGNDLDTQTIAVGTSVTVPKYSDTLKTGVGALLTDHQSDKWLITSADKYDVGTAVGGCGDVSRVYVSAVPRYTIDWDPNTTETYSPSVTTDAFKVTFDRTATASPINTSDATYKLTRTGYTFNGWKLADDTLNPVIKSDNVTTYDTLDGTTAAGPGPADYVIKLRADWTKNPTIECIYNCPLVSKKSFIYDTQTIVPGTAPVQPADPVEPGFTFGGWYADADCTKVFDFTITRTNDAKAYAKWTRNTNYTLTFNNNIPAGEVASKDTPDITGIQYYTTSGIYYTVTLPGAPVKSDGSSYEHYTFDGWSVNVTPTPSPAPNMYNGSVTMDKLITDLGADKSPIPMIANWTGKNYTIKMDYDAPAAVSPVPANPVDQTKPYGTGATSAISIAATMNPGVTSYTFAGWSLKKGAATADYTADTDVKTLVDAAEAAGVTFGSTSAAANNKDTLTLYGVWTPVNKTVSFNKNGHGDDVSDQTVPYGSLAAEPTPVPSEKGYDFKGWYEDDGTFANQWDFLKNTVTSDKTLYAQWVQKKYNLVFDTNTTGLTTPPTAVKPGDINGLVYTDNANLPVLTDTSGAYNFLGWGCVATATAADFNTTAPVLVGNIVDKYPAASIVINGDGTNSIALYAIWTNKPVYTVTWKDYNGTVLKTDAGVTAGTIPAYTGTPTKASDATNTYTFSGWNDGAASYAVGTALPALVADTTYTAYYSASVRNYTITWKDGDGNTLGTTTVAYGTVPTYTINKTPTKSADATYTYSFNNTWSPAIVAVTGDAIYTAQFTATAKPTGTSPAPTGTSPTPAIVTPTATPTPAVVTPTATPTPDPNGDGGNGGQGTPVEEKIYDIKYYEVDDDGNEIELKNTGNPKTYKYGEGAVIDKKLDREGYVFLGWFTKDGTKPVTKISKKAKGTKKLYARYEAVPEDDGTGDGNDNINGNPSDFSTLFVRLTNYTEDSMTLTWEAMEYIDGYDIFGSRCNSKDVIRPYEPITSVGADVTEYVMSDLLAKTYYKFYIRAYILVNNEKRYITTSINVHGVTLNDTYGVADEINIDKVVTKSGKKSRTKYNRAKDGDVEEINITMKVGQTLTIVTSEYNADGKEIRAHRPISFESSNPNICKVGKKNSHKYGVAVAGKANTYKSHTITAKAAGECTIWVFAQNGIYTKVNVKVKPAD